MDMHRLLDLFLRGVNEKCKLHKILFLTSQNIPWSQTGPKRNIFQKACLIKCAI